MRIWQLPQRILTSIVLISLLATVAPAAAQNGDPCADAPNGIAPEGYEIVWGAGGSGSQVVLGTEGPDALSGGSGHDILCGFGGNDVLDGGSGDDILYGGGGVNELHGGSGHDQLYGTSEHLIHGASGNDVRAGGTETEPPGESGNDAPVTASLKSVDLGGGRCGIEVKFSQGFGAGDYAILFPYQGEEVRGELAVQPDGTTLREILILTTGEWINMTYLSVRTIPDNVEVMPVISGPWHLTCPPGGINT